MSDNTGGLKNPIAALPRRKSVGEDIIDKEKVKRSLEIIDNDNIKKKEIYSRLVYLRTEVAGRLDGIQLLIDLNAHNMLFKKLSYANYDIVNLTVSVLSNLANRLITKQEYCSEIISLKVPAKIISILKQSHDPKMQIRLLRLIGNLVQSKDICREFHTCCAPQAIVSALNETNDREVQHMAIRALRWLWEIVRSRGTMVCAAHVVKAVSKHILSQDPVVYKAVLRALTRFTLNQSEIMTEQMKELGFVFETLATNIDQPSVQAIINNLTCEATARIELCKANIIQLILDRIFGSSHTNMHLINALCKLCRESMVRAALRHHPDGGVKSLVVLLKNPKIKPYYKTILQAINQFNYDYSSLLQMAHFGLVGALVKILKDFATTYCTGHNVVLIESDDLSDSLSMSVNTSSDVLPDLEYSPRHDTQVDFTPPSSPVQPIELPFSDIMVGMDDYILSILVNLSHQNTFIEGLVSSELIEVLLQYIQGLPSHLLKNNSSRAYKALEAICKNKIFWKVLLDTESILKIHSMLCRPAHSSCLDCSELKAIGTELLNKCVDTGESPFGLGELTYRLAHSGPEYSNRIAYVIPYVIRTMRTLESLLIKQSGLNKIIGMLDSYFIDEAVMALHVLGNSINISYIYHYQTVCTGCRSGEKRWENDITFMLDDGSLVHANKETVCRNSVMFEAMFRGDFIEADQRTIRLTKISRECLTYLLEILDGYCPCALPKNITVMLELITATDRFLRHDLTEDLTFLLCSNIMRPTVVPAIYDWSVNEGLLISASETIHNLVVIYLICEMSILQTERVRAISKIMKSKNRDIFLEELRDIFVCALQRHKHPYFIRPQENKSRRSIYV